MSDYTWEDFPVHVGPLPVVAERPRERIVSIAGARYLELPDNGYQLLFAWLAGPRRAYRRADTAEHTVTAIRRPRDDDTPQAVTVEARTDDDWETIDRFVNSFLREAGAPPRPRGFTWYLELPLQRTPDDVWHTVTAASADSPQENPSEVRDAMEAAIADLYSSA